MFFSDLLKNSVGTYKRKDSFPLVIKNTTQSASVFVENNTVIVDDVDKGTIFNNYCVEEENKDTKLFERRGMPYTYRDVEDTEDNPLIVVRTSAIRVYDNIPAYLEVLYVDSDSMLVMLVYGACDFQFEDGSFVALQRCNDINLDNRKIYTTFNAKQLFEKTLNSTKGGFNKSYEMVCPLFIQGSFKDSSLTVRFMKQNAVVFNQKVIDEREAFEESEIKKKKEIAEQKKKELEERLKVQAEERKIREANKKKEQEALKREKSASRSSSRRKTVEIEGNSSSGRSKGAMAFLDALSNK